MCEKLCRIGGKHKDYNYVYIIPGPAVWQAEQGFKGVIVSVISTKIVEPTIYLIVH